MARHRIGSGTIAATLLSICMALSLIIVLLLIMSEKPEESLYYFFAGPFLGSYYIEKMINVTVILICTGLGAAIAFKSGIINLGGEGQIYSAALVATIVALRFGSVTNTALPWGGAFFALGAGIAAGAVLAGISGLFRVLWNTDELLSTLLLSNAALPVIDFLISGPLRDEQSYLLATPKIDPRLWLSTLPFSNAITTGLLYVLLCAVGLALFLRFTVWGYKLKLCGLNREFAAYGGIPVGNYILFPMIVSGAFHGFGGGIWVLGSHHLAMEGFTSGMGWNGIVVALIARNNPWAVIPAAFLLAYLDMGSQTAILQTQFAFELGTLIQGVILLFITAHIVKTALRRKGTRELKK